MSFLQQEQSRRRQGPPSAEAARRRLLFGLPVAERRVEIAGTSTAFLEGGRGSPTIVLLHGGIECGGVMWAPVISRLAARHHLIVPDLPGLGQSEPLRVFDVPGFTEWLSELLRMTCRDRPVLVAHSLGGSMAAHFAAAWAGRLRELILYAAPAIGAYHIPLPVLVASLRFALRPSFRNMVRLERRAFFDLDKAKRDEPEWIAAFTSYTRERASVGHVTHANHELLRLGKKQLGDAELRAIDAPVSLVWGTRDRFVSIDLAEAASAKLAWPLHRIDDAGHVAHIERPDAFVRAVELVIAGEARRPHHSLVGIGW